MSRSLRLSLSCLLILFGLTTLCAARLPAATTGNVLVVPIDGVVDEGMAHLVTRAVGEANANHDSALVLDVNTPGGLLDAAFQIRDAVFDSKVPTIAYVSQRAYSAGALIALSASKIVMSPGASIGAAEPIPNDPKHVAAVRSEFGATAERNHRSPLIAEAMVDKSVDLPEYKKPGAILSLTAAEARRAGIADAIEPSLSSALAAEHFAGAPLERATYSWGEELARFATSPEVSGLLLSLGALGLLIELQTLHGIAGVVGVGALALFFGSHVYAGFSDAWILWLALVGAGLILVELHVVPGHGVAGILGVLVLFSAVVLSFGAFVFVAAQAISIAIVLSVICFFLASRVFPESAFMRRIVFSSQQGPDYVASSDHRSLAGRTGIAATYLRPAGVATIDGQRVDVLTEGDFLPAGSPIRVSRVEGARIFVAPAVSAQPSAEGN